jgi:regulation of enolase protein 1 (concanavalin A-like superfamily)
VMLRTAYLRSSQNLDVGLMCAAPQGPGFHITFGDLSIENTSTS